MFLPASPPFRQKYFLRIDLLCCPSFAEVPPWMLALEKWECVCAPPYNRREDVLYHAARRLAHTERTSSCILICVFQVKRIRTLVRRTTALTASPNPGWSRISRRRCSPLFPLSPPPFCQPQPPSSRAVIATWPSFQTQCGFMESPRRREKVKRRLSGALVIGKRWRTERRRNASRQSGAKASQTTSWRTCEEHRMPGLRVDSEMRCVKELEEPNNHAGVHIVGRPVSLRPPRTESQTCEASHKSENEKKTRPMVRNEKAARLSGAAQGPVSRPRSPLR